MDTNKSTNKKLGFALSFLAAALIFLAFVINVNSNLKSSLDVKKLQHDSILSTKLLLDKEIADLSANIGKLEGRNKKLDSVLLKTSIELDEKSKTIARLNVDNTSVKSLRKELKQVREMREKLNKQLEDITADYKKLSTENGKLKLQVESLEEQLAFAKANENRPAGFSAGNFRIELQKKNRDKLTVKGKRTKNIQIGFDFHSAEGKNNEETLYVKIVDPNGYVVTPDITPVVIKNEKIVYSSLEKVQLNGASQRVSANIKPEAKMKQKGVYKVMVYHPRDGMIGSSEIRTN